MIMHYVPKYQVRTAVIRPGAVNELHALGKRLPSNWYIKVSNDGVILVSLVSGHHEYENLIPANATLLDDGSIVPEAALRSDYVHVEVDPHCRAGLAVQPCATT